MLLLGFSLLYIDMMVEYGATIVAHNMSFGGGKNKGNRFLDRNGMIYRLKLELPATHILRTDNTFSNLANSYKGNIQREYELSRVCSIFEGKIFCDANRRTITIET